MKPKLARVFLVLVALFPSGPSASSRAGLDGETVGITKAQFVDRARNRPLSVELWYPATAAATAKAIVYDRIYRGKAAPDAGYEDTGSPRPLVLLSHGDRGGNTDQSWLAEYLAQRGFIVAAINHWQNTADHYDPAETIRVWNRPADVSFVLTQLLSDAAWKTRIDPRRVGVAGHSSGGYTALALVGARYDWMQMAKYCQGPSRGPDCDLAGGVDFAKIDFSESGKDFTDRRIKAAFAMAPALGAGVDKSSLARITSPVEIVYAKDDELVRPDLNALYYADSIKGAALDALEDGGHFVFLPQCTTVGRIISYTIAFDICGRKTKGDRGALHEQIAGEAVRFFDKSLGVPR